MSATYALPGEVIEVRQLLSAVRAADLRAEELDPLPVEIEPGYYALVAQRGKRLFIAAVSESGLSRGEGLDGQVEVAGPMFVGPASILETTAVGVSYLVVRSIEQE